jgi:TP901 family phage tail tape measure protein
MGDEQKLILSFMGQAQDALKGIDGLKAGLLGMEKKLGDVGDKAEQVGKSVGQRFKDAGDVVQRASMRIEGAIGGMARRALGLLGVGGLAGAIYKSVGAYQDFEQVVMRLSLRMGNEGSKAIQKYTDQLRRLSKQGGTSVAELARGLEQVIASDVKGAKTATGSMKLLEASNKAAIASMTDTSQVVDVVSAVMESYGLSVDDASVVTDTLFATMRNGDVSIESLLGGIKGITLLAAPMGIKFEEVGAAMAALTKGNLESGQAFGALELVLRAMIKPTTQMNALLKANGFNSMEAMVKAKGLTGVLQALQKATGGSAFQLGKFVQRAEGVKGMSILAGTGLQDFKDALKATGDAAGTTEKMYASMSETFAQRTARFKQTMSDTFLKIGEKIMPTVNDLMDRFSAWVDKNGDKIADFFKDVGDAIVEFGGFLLKHGPAIAATIGAVWAGGKLIDLGYAISGIATAVKAFGAALAAIPELLAAIPALAAGVSSALLPIAAAISTIGVTVLALKKNKEAFAEGKAQAEAARGTYANIRGAVPARFAQAGVFPETYQAASEGAGPGGLGEEFAARFREDLIRQGIEQFTAERGAKPTLMQAQKVRAAVEQGIKDAMEAVETKQRIGMFGEFAGQSIVEAMKSDDIQAAGKEAFKKATADGAAEGLTDPKVRAAMERAADLLARQYKDALKLLESLRLADATQGLDDIGRAEMGYYKEVNRINAQMWKEEADREEALSLAKKAHEAELDEIYKKRFDEGMKRDEEIANKRKKYEKEIDDLTTKAFQDYAKARDSWQEQMRQKYPQAYAEFEVAEGQGLASAAPESQTMFGMGNALQDFMSQAKDWITGMLKQLGDAVADVGMDFAGVFLDLFKTPMAQLKQLLGQAIELAAEGKQYLVLTNREKAETEARIGRPLTDAEMREMAEVISPTELESMKREGRAGEYTIVGERTPEQAANSVLDKFVAFWENLADNLDGILKWIESTAFPRLINAIVKALPKIIAAIIGFVKATATSLAKDWLPKILDVVFDLIPKLIKGVSDSIKSFLHNLDIERLINSIINFIIDLIITIVKDVIDLIANVIPDLISKINHAIPGIVANLVKAIVMELIPEIVMALVDAIKTIFTGDNITGSKTWDGILTLVTGGISGTVGKYLHEGGMISRDLLGSSRALEGAIRAHQGMFVGAGGLLRPDEVPIIAQMGEAVLNRQAVANLGGEGTINRINSGETPGGSGGGVTVVNNVSVAHMLSRDTERVIDEMQGDSLRRRTGQVHKQMTRGRVLGFVPRSG